MLRNKALPPLPSVLNRALPPLLNGALPPVLDCTLYIMRFLLLLLSRKMLRNNLATLERIFQVAAVSAHLAALAP
jgi:hypothetical protein